MDEEISYPEEHVEPEDSADEILEDNFEDKEPDEKEIEEEEEGLLE